MKLDKNEVYFWKNQKMKKYQHIFVQVVINKNHEMNNFHFAKI